MWYHEAGSKRVSRHPETFCEKGLPTRGDHKSCRNGNISMVVWQDNKAICCASTNSNPSTSKDINRKLKDGTTLTIHCPECIVSYNTYMGELIIMIS